jgi:hypothetical protein
MTHSLSREAEAFLRQTPLVRVEAICEDAAVVPAAPGIYGWWFDDSMESVSAGTLSRNGRHLLYVGIAPSSRPQEGRKPRTLRDRLINHCRGPLATSTLRRTLAALLNVEAAFSIGIGPSGKLMMLKHDEVKLTRWMDDHAMVMWSIAQSPWLIEDELLEHGPRLPLNIQGSRDPYRLELKKLRASLHRS